MSENKKEEEEEKLNPLIEHFYIIGLNPDIIKKDEFYTSPQKYIEYKILSKFPPIERYQSYIKDNILISHCFPNGFNIINSKAIPPKQTFYFSLQNIFPSSQGGEDSIVYFTCIKFYESLSKYYAIKNKLSKYIDKEVNNNKNKKNNEGFIKRRTVFFEKTPYNLNKEKAYEDYYVPKVICFSSLTPYPYELGYLLEKILKHSGFGFDLDSLDKKIDKIENKDIGKKKNNKGDSDDENDNNNFVIIPLEKIIEKLLMEIPSPPRGIYHIKFIKDDIFFKNNEKELIIKPKEINQYICPSYSLQSIFTFQTIDIISIYKSLLLEIPILFFCENANFLTTIYESFMSLLYPFKYQYPHVSILPDINYSIIQNCESFSFGINEKWEKDGKYFFDRNNLKIYNKLIIICDIHKKKIFQYIYPLKHLINYIDLGKNIMTNNNTIANDINHENKSEYINYTLPSGYNEKLKKKLDNFKAINNNNLKYFNYNENFNKLISEDCFYYFLISILSKYNNFLYNDEERIKTICKDIFCKGENEIDIKDIFNVDGFLHETKSCDANFYNAFFKTKLFLDFIEKKYYNRKRDKPIYLNFDESIIKKRNKSIFNKTIETPFINLTIFENKNNYDVMGFNFFAKEELEYIINNKKELLEYYQSFEGNCFKYLMFPRLLYDNKFFNNKKYVPNYKYKSNAFEFSKIYKNICKEIYSDKLYYKIYLGDLIVQYKFIPGKTLYDKEIINSLYLLWLRIFCLTFYYCDEQEKNLRFYEMIFIVRKLVYIKDDIFSLILSTLEIYGTNIMIIQFFNILKNYNYIQFTYLTHKLVKKDKIKSLLKKMNISNTPLIINYFTEEQEEYIIPHINGEDKNQLRQRTFGINNENNEEQIFFSQYIKCEKCNDKLEIAGLTINFNNMKKTLNLLCSCSADLTNKIVIKVNGKYFKIKLYEPYYLYKKVSSEIIKIYGNKISLDELREKYKDFYWNLIWYFRIQGLSYDMLLKYKDDSNLHNKINTNIINKKKRKFNCLQISSNIK